MPTGHLFRLLVITLPVLAHGGGVGFLLREEVSLANGLLASGLRKGKIRIGQLERSVKLNPSQPQCVGDNRHGAKAHGRAGEHRIQENAEGRVEQTCGDRNS